MSDQPGSDQPAVLHMADENQNNGGPNISPKGNAGEPEAKKERKIKVPAAFATSARNMMPPAQRQQMDLAYAVSLPGLLKLATIVISFVLFCCTINSGGSGAFWMSLMCWTSMWLVGGLLAVYVVFPHSLADERTRTGVVLLELFFYLTGLFFFFIGIWMMVAASVYYGNAGSILSTILGVGITVVYAVESFFKFMAWRQITGAPQGTTQQMP